jgi:hypothetical protein
MLTIFSFFYFIHPLIIRINNTIKTKAKNRLDIKGEMRVALLNMVPDFKAILQLKQQQMSH